MFETNIAKYQEIALTGFIQEITQNRQQQKIMTINPLERNWLNFLSWSHAPIRIAAPYQEFQSLSQYQKNQIFRHRLWGVRCFSGWQCFPGWVLAFVDKVLHR